MGPVYQSCIIIIELVIKMLTPKDFSKLDSNIENNLFQDVMGRTIKVEFSKSFRRPAQPPPPGTIIERHKLYVSNLPWKARAPNVKEFFANFNPLSANVIFDNGKAAGYGFVSFGTKEEAEAALTELDGKVLHTNFKLTFFVCVCVCVCGHSIPPSHMAHASIPSSSVANGR